MWEDTTSLIPMKNMYLKVKFCGVTVLIQNVVGYILNLNQTKQRAGGHIYKLWKSHI